MQILRCYAPDYCEGHDEVKLRQLCMPIAKAMAGVQILETLVQTLSELVIGAAWVLGMVIMVYNEQG